MPMELNGEFSFGFLEPIPTVTRILRKGRVTIVFFGDGTKSIARRPKDEPDDPYYGVCAAIAKRVVGSGTKLKQLVENMEWPDLENPKKTKAETSKKPKRFEHVTVNFGDDLAEIFNKLYDKGDCK